MSPRGSDRPAPRFKVNKPVTLLAAFPRFLSLGDRASFGAVVTNTLAAGGGAAVTIRSLDPGVLAVRRRRVTHGSTRGRSARSPSVSTRSRAAVGTARVQMTVRLGNETDAFETTLAVSAPGAARNDAPHSATRTSERLSVLPMPAGVAAGVGGLNVELSSTALVGLGEGARYLADYPYGCGEQKASAALALALAADLGNALRDGAHRAGRLPRARAHAADRTAAISVRATAVSATGRARAGSATSTSRATSCTS